MMSLSRIKICSIQHRTGKGVQTSTVSGSDVERRGPAPEIRPIHGGVYYLYKCPLLNS
jgi:hypothetical protein